MMTIHVTLEIIGGLPEDPKVFENLEDADAEREHFLEEYYNGSEEEYRKALDDTIVTYEFYQWETELQPKTKTEGDRT